MAKIMIELTKKQREIMTLVILDEISSLSRIHQECLERGINTAPIEAREKEIHAILDILTERREA